MKRGTLFGKVVAITGATGGMGRAFCRQFGRAGAKIGMLDLSESALAEFAAVLAAEGIESHPQVCDVTDISACDKAIANIESRFGGLDILINNAGITHRSLFAETDISVFRRVMEVNYFGTLHCTLAALPYLIESRGMIIAISSIAGFSPLLGRSGYSASKYALHGLLESLRAELVDQGVRVMMVCPGFTATGIEKNALAGDGTRTTRPRSTAGKIYPPETVADAVLRGALKNKKRLVLSRVGKLAYWISRVFPDYYEKAMTKRLRHEFVPAPPPDPFLPGKGPGDI